MASGIHRQATRVSLRPLGRVMPAAVLLGLLTLTVSGEALGASVRAASVRQPLPASNYSTQRVCAAPTSTRPSCFARVLVPKTPAARARQTPIGDVLRTSATPRGLPREGAYGLRPVDLHSSYNLPVDAAKPQTIALVDAYDDPTAEGDLAAYDAEFGLPACTSANGCFVKLNQSGASSPLPQPEPGWGLEISLDIESAHAVCQNCRIMLVEANSNYFSDLEAAEHTAVAQGATEISNSYGASGSYESPGYNYPGVVVTASSGDWGYQQPGSFPATSPDVVAVGGTTLLLKEGHRSSEIAWSGAGSGCSEFAAAPAWQQALSDWPSVGCAGYRASADVSADADPNSGFAVYDSSGYFGPEPWLTVGGTSLASPVVAATFARAGGSGGVAYPAETLYANQRSLHDVVEGASGVCEAEAICTAGAGYDGPTGLGTPEGLTAFEAPDPTSAPTVTSVKPAEGSTAGGTSVTIAGTNLGSARAVRFGGAPATITSDAEGSITAISPAHAQGVVAVVVVGRSGLASAESSADRFTYDAPAPTVTGISPSEGSTSGGTTVTITGTNLSSAAAVQFGGASAAITSNSEGSITAVSPAHSAGTVAVIVVAQSGATSAESSADRFAYVRPAPVVSAVSPGEGSAAGGALVTVRGSALGEVEQVHFGSARAAIVSRSESALTAISPQHAAGTVDVTVRGANGASSAGPGDTFTYTESTSPRLSDVRWSPRELIAGGSPILRLTLSENATVIVTVAQEASGHIANGRCVPSRHRGAACVAEEHGVTLTLSGEAGRNVFRLPLAKLRPGRYEARIVARDASGRRSRVVTVSFVVTTRR